MREFVLACLGLGNGLRLISNVFNSYLNGVVPRVAAVPVVVCRPATPPHGLVADVGDVIGQGAVADVCWGISSWDELSDWLAD